MSPAAPRSTLLVVLATFALGCAQEAAPPPAPPASRAAAPGGSVSVGGSATAATTTTPAPAAAAPARPAGAPAIATADHETPGIRAEVTELKRGSGGTVSLKMALVNDSDKAFSLGYDLGDPAQGAADYAGIGGVHLIDPVGKKKYFVARDSAHKCVCSQPVATIAAGSRANVWAKFPAPPEDVQQISIVIPKFSPMDDVPLSR